MKKEEAESSPVQKDTPSDGMVASETTETARRQADGAVALEAPAGGIPMTAGNVQGVKNGRRKEKRA